MNYTIEIAQRWQFELVQLVPLSGNFLSYIVRVSHRHCYHDHMAIMVCIESQTACNVLSGTLHQNVPSIGAEVDRSAKLVAICLSDTIGKKNDLSRGSRLKILHEMMRATLTFLSLVQEN